jgi:hypothetical protein
MTTSPAHSHSCYSSPHAPPQADSLPLASSRSAISRISSSGSPALLSTMVSPQLPPPSISEEDDDIGYGGDQFTALVARASEAEKVNWRRPCRLGDGWGQLVDAGMCTPCCHS